MDNQIPRRGPKLETALREAGWAVLEERGYQGCTYEAVADRAQTSRPVLYRRWATRNDMIMAILLHQINGDPIEIPDTGSLRDDAIQLLRNANRARARTVARTTRQLAEFFEASGKTYADILNGLHDAGTPGAFETIIARARARGESVENSLPDLVIGLPFRLLRDELSMTMKPVPDDFLETVVDGIWLPLVASPAVRPDCPVIAPPRI